ncbi:hypothetical protein AB1Y20_014377 [Prymnesium parvum]|uniref:Uncharacterized protein n=2 Tax=Prymnesium parvum TaxID=97485 RepID=A0AB34IGM4_PRYPA
MYLASVQEDPEVRQFALDKLVQLEMRLRNYNQSPYDMDVSGNVAAAAASSKVHEALLMDVPKERLPQIASSLGKEYLSTAPGDQCDWPLRGFLYGMNYRPMLVCPVRTKLANIWVVFLVDTGAPCSSVSGQVLEILVGPGGFVDLHTKVRINGVLIDVAKSQGNHEDIHLLGADYLGKVNAQLTCNYNNRSMLLAQQEETSDDE